MRYERKIDDKFRYQHYPSVSDALEFPMPKANQDRWHDCMSDSRNGLEWFGDSSIKTGYSALKTISHGWKKGMDRANRELPKIALPKLPSIKRRRVRKDFGDTLDINRVYTGRLDTAWQTTERARRNATSGGKVNLFLNYGIHAGEDADNVFWRGALAAKLIDALQNTGRRVRFVCYNNVIQWAENRERGPQRMIIMSVTVKDYHHPMAIDQLMTAAAFAGFFRGVGFKLILSQEESVSYSLGRKPEDDEMQLPLILDPNETNIVIDQHVTDKSKMMAEFKRITTMFE